MESLNSLSEHLQIAADRLDQAANEIRDLPLEPTKKHIRLIAESLANIFQIQHQIYEQAPELKPDYLKAETPKPDPDLTEDEKLLVEKLSLEEIQEIDNLLLSHAHSNWRKVAMIVGLTMSDLENRAIGIPDIFFAQRVRKLVDEGRLDSQGNLQYIRFSEVRLPSGK